MHRAVAGCLIGRPLDASVHGDAGRRPAGRGCRPNLAAPITPRLQHGGNLLYGDPHREAAVRDGRWKLIAGEGAPRLYALDRDAAERRDIASRHPDVSARLARALGTPRIARSVAPLPARDARALRALGYVVD